MKQVNISLHKAYSTDGVELDSILFSPKKKTNQIIIHVHGKEGNFVQNHFVSILGNKYAENGYAFLTFNNRGHDYMADLLKKPQPAISGNKEDQCLIFLKIPYLTLME